jgi:hypothetical protein
MTSPFVRVLIALMALMALWFGLAVLIAGIRAALEGYPDSIGTVISQLTPLIG